MKKILGLIVIVVAIRVIVGTNFLINFGATKYYAETNSNYIKDGTLYLYKIDGYNEDGKKETLDFTTSKVLKTNRFLKIYKRNNEVKSYEEIKSSDLPTKVKEIYHIK
ncbi:MAG: YxeA family protein [Clostridium baratii]|uniref:YxeA family protein n=1 Tax=Clostridium baratii str. Sullivan TaxID=1415775 RepID=A0A0A7FXU2_9CLOT|nr:YxeA family protein [Clostridium baratii]AIY84459.1 hypothetical protein U729_640 [Clostridium baratii str. Sullivan]MBS6007132.1 YxeA family protein [Clostridium baratii]MDU1054112.1 YxeA family protein [Clostridium baratii]MDU4911011.1 YxeA family protein [Clostridium baratii]CUP50783.1 Uncharacterized protein conserved in bacteria [Clostridium baratii]